MSSRAPAAALMFALALGLAACADVERGDPLPVDAGAEASPASDAAAGDGGAAVRSFARDVHPLLVDLCARCHGPSGSASNSGLVLGDDAARDLPQVQGFLNQANPAGSRLLSKGAGSGHGGGAIIAPGTPEHRTILEWITQGSAP